MPAAEAFIATLVISTVPNLILYLIPDSFLRWERGLDYMLCFAAGALLGDVVPGTPSCMTYDNE